jgi:hypothetical protein
MKDKIHDIKKLGERHCRYYCVRYGIARVTKVEPLNSVLSAGNMILCRLDGTIELHIDWLISAPEEVSINERMNN